MFVSFDLHVSGFYETDWMETLRVLDRMPNVLVGAHNLWVS